MTFFSTDRAENVEQSKILAFTIVVVNPDVTLTSPASGAVYPVGTVVNFAGNFSDDQCNVHTAVWMFDSISRTGTVNETTREVNSNYTFTSSGVYLVTLTVNNNCGGTGSTDTVNGLTAMVVIYDPDCLMRCDSSDRSDLYLGELVRYIYLSPVRAKMVESVEEYPYSSHRAYLGIEPAGIVDIDPVLRLFGSKREEARRHFAVYTGEAKKLGSREDLYNSEKGILGSSEFVDATIHRLGDTGFVPKPTDGRRNLPLVDLDTESLLLSVEQVAGISREDFCHAGKSARAVAAKEALIVSGRRLGGTTTILAAITGLNIANISRRHDSGLMRISSDPKFNEMVKCVTANHEESRHKESRDSQA